MKSPAATRKRRRMTIVALAMLTLAAAAALVLTAFEDNLVFFYSPSDVAGGKAPEGRPFRIGGLVEEGSVSRAEDGGTIRFAVTDGAHSVPVTYSGIVPDLFREGQGIVAEGRLNEGGNFVAREVLAKHDENYMPPEVAKALKDAGMWQEGESPAAGKKPGYVAE